MNIVCVNRPCDRPAVCNPIARCAKNRAPFTPPTVREQLEAGPKFVASEGICIACGRFREDESTQVDKSTGLGIKCWRSWRWSSVRERSNQVNEQPGQEA